MIDSLTPAARLPQTDPDQAEAVAHAEGRATLELLGTLGGDDWARPTDCTEWDVRALVAHLVAQCQDGIHLASVVRRELLSRRRYPDKPPWTPTWPSASTTTAPPADPSWSSASRHCAPGPPGPPPPRRGPHSHRSTGRATRPDIRPSFVVQGCVHRPL